MSSINKIIFDIIRCPPIFFILLPFYFANNSVFKFVICNKHLQLRTMFEYQIKSFTFLYIYYLLTNLDTVKLLLLTNIFSSFFGILLFHLQHSVNIGCLKSINNNNDKINADINGSSFLKIPNFLKYFTFGIEYHHIHHFSTRIPGYNLKILHDELNSIKEKQEVGYLQAFKSLFHVYYNEKTNRYESQYIFKIIGLEH